MNIKIPKINYQEYLSYDNKKGILLPKSDVEILKKYNINIDNYNSVKDIIQKLIQIEETYEMEEELEYLLNRLGEYQYYHETNK